MVAHLFGVIAEWTVVLGVLVYAFDAGGATATGLASISLLLPYLIVGPVSGALATRYPPQRIRVLGFGLQALGYAVAALAAASGLALPLVLLPAAIAVAGVTTLRPTAAMVLPGLVRSSRELTVGNLWGGYCENLGALGGPLLATAFLTFGGPASALAGCAALATASLIVVHVPRPIDPPAASDRAWVSVFQLAVATLGELRRRRGALTLLSIAGVQFLVVGALDILVVVIAQDEFDLGPGAPGWFLAAFGIGSLLSTVVATRVAGRRHQARAIGTAVVSIAVLSLILAGVLAPITVVVILPLIGMSQGLADVLSDVLLHRSVPPDRLAGVYALLEFSSGAGLIAGSLIAQVAIAASGPRLALVGIGVFLLAVVAVSIGGLRAADTTANVPVVEMSLLRRVPLFAPLPETALEDVARSAVEVDVLAATPLIVAGESGDRFFVVADGSFEVAIDGQPIATVERGGSFGEIALLADVARTASVTAREPSRVLAIERRPFLVAVTGHDSSRQAAWGVMHALRGDDLPIAGPDDFAEGGEP